MSRRAAVCAAMLLLSGCTLPWGKPEEPPVPGTHLVSQIHGFTAVVPEEWVPLESSPVSFPDPNPFPGQSERQIFVRTEPRAVLSVDVMLTPSDGRTVLPEKADTARVGDLLAAIIYASRGIGDPAPRIAVQEKDLRYDFTRRSHSGAKNRYLGLARPRSGGGFIVVAVIGAPDDPSLDATLDKVRGHLKVD